MNKLSSQLRYRFLFLALLAGLVLMLYSAWTYLVPEGWKGGVPVVFQPKSVTVVPGAGQRLIQSDCSAIVVSEDFDPQVQADTCSFSAYSRPRKHVYITLNTYFPTQVRGVDEDWRRRWNNLNAQLASRDEVQWGGKRAIRFVETYPQNNESMVTYILYMDNALPLKNGVRIKEFELRAWYTSESDRQIVDAVVQRWQWRF